MLQRIAFSIAGEEQYDRAFQVLEHDARDLREPLQGAADVFHDSVVEQFTTQGAHGLGTRWQALSKPYREWKAKRYPGEPILVASGDLKAAWTAFPEQNILDLTEHQLVWGVAPDVLSEDGASIETISSAHQAGEGHMPQRKIIALSSDDRRRVDREFVEYFSSRTRRLAVL